MPDSPAKRERRVLELLYERGNSTASEIQEALQDGSSYSAVRGVLRVMEEKQLVTHESVRGRYTYSPLRSKTAAAKEALSRLVQTYFDGRADHVVATLLTDQDRALSEEELNRLRALLDQAEQTEP